MCGISALFSTTHQNDVKSVLPMTEIIAHRGPDDSGCIFFPEGEHQPETNPQAFNKYIGAFGHRRLSILDLTKAGHQPMSTSDKRYWVTYNGEVYNYLEIRKELIALGYHFHTQTDTEVVLNAYVQWGIKCLERFNGMFAFVIYDHKTKRVFAARDRFGVKPLYFWRSPKGLLAFASEIKQFTTLPEWQPIVNGQRAYEYLNWGVTDHTDETLFEGVKQLQGGHFIEAKIEPQPSLEPKKWYDLSISHYSGSFDEATSQFAHLFQDSIRLRLRSDVAIGSCLSGGLDSSSIVCVAKGSVNQNTFSARSDVTRFDEGRFIDRVVSHTGATAHSVIPSVEALFQELDQLIWHLDEPFNSTSIFAQWCVFRLAKQNNVKVILDGQGADEQLAGYHGYFGNHLYGLLRSLRLKEALQEAVAIQQLHGTHHHGIQALARLLPSGWKHGVKRLLGKQAMAPDWLNSSILHAQTDYPFQGKKEHFVHDQSRLQLQSSSLPMLLRYEDRNSMAHSIESRTPFLDYRLVEHCLNLPAAYKIHRGWTKRVLREAMKGILPEQIRSRVDKIGFATAEEVWMTKQNPALFQQALKEGVRLSQGILSPKASTLLDEMIAGRRPFTFLPWRLICFGRWMDRFGLERVRG